MGLVAQRLEQRTHNAHEGIAQEAAGLGNKTQIASVYAVSNHTAPRIQEHQGARFIKPN